MRQPDSGGVIASKPGSESGPAEHAERAGWTRKAAGAGDRGAPVGALAPEQDERAGLASAATEVAVIEGKRGEPGAGKELAVAGEALVVDAGEAHAEHDAGSPLIAARGRAAQPSDALLLTRGEADLIWLHRVGRLARNLAAARLSTFTHTIAPWPTWRRSAA